MALAHKLNIEGNAARHLPQEQAPRPARRPAPQPRPRSYRAIVMIALGWLCVMAFALGLIHRNALILEETSALTKQREVLAIYELENKELAAAIDTKVSVAEVEKWALAHGMTRPPVARPLQGDPAAVAVRPVAPASAAEAPAAKPSIWEAFKGYVARMTGFAQSAQ